MSNALLKVQKLNKSFVTRYGVNRAVNNVSFEVKEKEIVGLVGQSGSGKTTVGNSVLRLLNEVSGIVLLDDKIVSGKRIPRDKLRYLRKNVQMIFQDPHSSLNEKMNIFSALVEPLKVHKILKNELNQIFGNWDNITKIFGLELKAKFLEVENSFSKLKNEYIIDFYSQIEKQLNNFDFTKYNDANTAFLELLDLYYHDRFVANNQIITSLVDANKVLLDYFIACKNQLSDLKLDDLTKKYVLDEKRFKELKEQVFNANFPLCKIFKNVFKIEKHQWVELRTTHANFVSAISDAKNNAKLQKEIALISRELNPYKDSMVNYAISKAIENNLKLIKKEVKLLTSVEFVDFLNDINLDIASQAKAILKNSSSILGSNFNQEEFKKLIKEIKSLKFDFSTQVKANAKNFDSAQKYEESFLNNLVNEFKQEGMVKLSRKERQEHLSNAKTKFDSIESSFKKHIDDLNSKRENSFTKIIADSLDVKKELESFGLKDYVKRSTKSFNDIVKKMIVHFDLKKGTKTLEEIRSKLTNEIKALKSNSETPKLEIKNKIKELKNLVHEHKTKHRIDFRLLGEQLKELKIRNKSFDVEIKKLLKGFYNIKYLYGTEDNIKSKSTLYKRFVIKQMILYEKIFSTLRAVGLKPEHAYRYPHEFSGGQKQRIVIARALMSEPKLIVADEPIASLDISIQAQVVNLLKDIVQNRNMSMIFIGHDLTMVEYIADRTLVMHFGKIVEQGNSNKIFDNPAHIYTKTLFDSIPKISNASLPFISYGNVANYLQEYNSTNQPEYIEVEKDHFVLATPAQIKKWSKNENK